MAPLKRRARGPLPAKAFTVYKNAPARKNPAFPGGAVKLSGEKQGLGM